MTILAHMDFEPTDFGEFGEGVQLMPTFHDALMSLSPTAWWRMNEASGSVVHDHVGDRHGTINGTLDLAQSGALAFEDDTAIGFGSGYISIPHDAMMSFSAGQTISLCAWLASDAIAANMTQYIISQGRLTLGSHDHNWALRLSRVGDLSQPVPGFLYRNAANTAWHRWRSDESFVVGSGFHMLAMSYTFADGGSMAMWLDGRPVSGSWTMGDGHASPWVNSKPAWIGSNQDDYPSLRFAGRLDEVALFRHALSDNQVLSLYRKGVGR